MSGLPREGDSPSTSSCPGEPAAAARGSSGSGGFARAVRPEDGGERPAGSKSPHPTRWLRAIARGEIAREDRRRLRSFNALTCTQARASRASSCESCQSWNVADSAAGSRRPRRPGCLLRGELPHVGRHGRGRLDVVDEHLDLLAGDLVWNVVDGGGRRVVALGDGVHELGRGDQVQAKRAAM